jgi:hypothetical protein
VSLRARWRSARHVRRQRRGVAPVLVTAAVLGCLLVAAPITLAESSGPLQDAASALRNDSVYVDPAANRNLDIDAVRRAIGTDPIKIAIVPKIDSVGDVAVLPRQLARDLPGNTIAVISGRYFYAGSEVVCKGQAGQAAANAINANEAALDANPSADSPSDITKPLTDFVAEIKAAPRCPQEGGRGDRYADEPGGGAAAAGADDTATVLPWVLGGVGIVVVAVATFVLVNRTRTRRTTLSRREQATELVRRLGAEVAELPIGEGAAASARADAAGRHGEAEAILIGATTDTQFGAARNAAIEGLIAARQARVALGRDPGPEIPQPHAGTEPDRADVRVSGEQPATDTSRR